MAVVRSADNWKQLYIPVGFAHAYCTLEPDTKVIYKVSAYYDPKAERGLAWDDRDLAISWPVSAQAAILTERDREWPRLRELADCYLYSDWPD
jgi:dTDP-4-dehydrorhamnose 3,5-epimerase